MVHPRRGAGERRRHARVELFALSPNNSSLARLASGNVPRIHARVELVPYRVTKSSLAREVSGNAPLPRRAKGPALPYLLVFEPRKRRASGVPGNVCRVDVTRLAAWPSNPSRRGDSARGGRLGGQGEVARDQQRGGQPAAADRASHVGVGGDVAARADRAAVGAGHDAAADQRGRVHRSRHGPRRDPQLQSRRLRRALSALSGWAAADVHAAQAPGDQADRAERSAGSRSAVRDLEPGQAGRLPGRRGGGHGHLPRGAAAAAARGGRPLSSGEDLEALQRPGLRGQARPDRRALRARRGRRGGRDLPRRVRPAEPPAAARRQGLGAPRQAQADPRDLHPPARRPASDRGLRRRRRPPLRTRQTAQGPRRVPRLLPLHPQPLPARDPAALRAGQLQPAQGREGPRVGGRPTTSNSPTRRSTRPG